MALYTHTSTNSLFRYATVDPGVVCLSGAA